MAQTIQLTSKKLKAQILFSGLIMAISTVGTVLSLMGGNTNILWFSGMSFSAGLVWYIATRIRIWWHHE